MSMKKTDLVKHLAKKLDGRMKGAGVPERFAQGSANAGAKRAERTGGGGGATKADAATPRLVAVTCRLPADLVSRLRKRAVDREGGIHALLAEALQAWFASQAERDAR